MIHHKKNGGYLWRRFRTILASFSFSVMHALQSGIYSSETSPDAIKTQVIHTKRKGKSILFFPSLILNYSARSLYSHTNSHNNAITQYGDGAQRACATCANSREIFRKSRKLQIWEMRTISATENSKISGR